MDFSQVLSCFSRDFCEFSGGFCLRVLFLGQHNDFGSVNVV